MGGSRRLSDSMPDGRVTQSRVYREERASEYQTLNSTNASKLPRFSLAQNAQWRPERRSRTAEGADSGGSTDYSSQLYGAELPHMQDASHCSDDLLVGPGGAQPLHCTAVHVARHMHVARPLHDRYRCSVRGDTHALREHRFRRFLGRPEGPDCRVLHTISWLAQKVRSCRVRRRCSCRSGDWHWLERGQASRPATANLADGCGPGVHLVHVWFWEPI